MDLITIFIFVFLLQPINTSQTTNFYSPLFISRIYVKTKEFVICSMLQTGDLVIIVIDSGASFKEAEDVFQLKKKGLKCRSSDLFRVYIYLRFI